MVAQIGYLVAVRSRGRVTPYAVCTWHVESAGFLVEPQNQGRRFVSGLALGVGLLATSHVCFAFSRLVVCHKLDFKFNN
jgi:hypothetical protein